MKRRTQPDVAHDGGRRQALAVRRRERHQYAADAARRRPDDCTQSGNAARAARADGVALLVERFDIESYSDFSSK